MRVCQMGACFVAPYDIMTGTAHVLTVWEALVPGLVFWPLCFGVCRIAGLLNDPRGNTQLPSVLFSSTIPLYLIHFDCVTIGRTFADGTGIGSPNTPHQVRAMAWSACWFVIDLMHDLYIGAHDVAMLAHHVFGFAVCALPLGLGLGSTEVCTFLALAEVSTPLLALSRVYKGRPQGAVLEIGFALTFLCVRGCGMAALLPHVVRSSTHPTIKALSVALCCISYYWIAIIAKKLVRKLCGWRRSQKIS